MTRAAARGSGDGRRGLPRAAAWLRTTFALVGFCLPAALALAQPIEDNPLARRVKAAFIYQFIPYVEWPARAFAAADSPIVVSVVGSEQAVAELHEVIGERTAQGRPVVIRRWRDDDARGGVHLAYVTRQQAERLPAVARAAQSTGMLVVAEQDNGLDAGAMINFRLVEGRVRFDVALGPAERAGLRISSRLLTVAQSVRPATP